jgi:hypothetical protein
VTASPDKTPPTGQSLSTTSRSRRGATCWDQVAVVFGADQAGHSVAIERVASRCSRHRRWVDLCTSTDVCLCVRSSVRQSGSLFRGYTSSLMVWTGTDAAD